MMIAVENGLDSVKAALKAQGHEIVSLDSDSFYHAAVYLRSPIQNIPVPRFTSKNAPSHNGVFLVNAHGRTPEEICSIIRQKAYGKLF